MPVDRENVLHELAVGDAAVVADIVERAATSDDVPTVVAAALFGPIDRPALMARAASLAVTTGDRQSSPSPRPTSTVTPTAWTSWLGTTSSTTPTASSPPGSPLPASANRTRKDPS